MGDNREWTRIHANNAEQHKNFSRKEDNNGIMAILFYYAHSDGPSGSRGRSPSSIIYSPSSL